MKTVQVTTPYGRMQVVPLDAEGRLQVSVAIHRRRGLSTQISVCLPDSSLDTYDALLADAVLPAGTRKEAAIEELKTLLMLVEVKYGCECTVVRELI